ncbi:MAG: M1 family metallopeptidase, partial [Clostridia bacterium]
MTDSAHAGRLPRTVIPYHYEIELVPDLESGALSGAVMVRVRIEAPVHTIELHSAGLSIEGAMVLLDDGGLARAVVEAHPDLQRVALHLPDIVPVGEATISLRFSGTMSEGLGGLYRRTVSGRDGGDVVIAATQCFPTDARRVFPCWDEPDFKAGFVLH